MLSLVFSAGGARYALPVDTVREVAPMVVFREIPGAPEAVRGLMNYRGEITPVIDLTSVLSGRPSKRRLSTRIVIVDYRGADGKIHALGLLAERVTDAFSYEPSAVRPPGIEVEGAPYLTGVIADRQGMIQLVNPARILPPSLRDALFIERKDDGHAV